MGERRRGPLIRSIGRSRAPRPRVDRSTISPRPIGRFLDFLDDLGVGNQGSYPEVSAPVPYFQSLSRGTNRDKSQEQGGGFRSSPDLDRSTGVRRWTAQNCPPAMAGPGLGQVALASIACRRVATRGVKVSC